MNYQLHTGEYLRNLPAIYHDGILVKGEHNFMVIISSAVIDAAGITKEEFFMKSKKRHIVHARQVFSFLVSKHSRIRQSTIADFIFYKDRSAVSDLINVCKDLIQTKYEPILNIIDAAEYLLFTQNEDKI